MHLPCAPTAWLSAARCSSAVASLLLGFTVTRGDGGPRSDAGSSKQSDWSQSFESLDTDGSRLLSVQEFLVDADADSNLDRRSRRRDFTMFDFDGDQALNKMEFAVVHGFATDTQLLPIPDPFDKLAEQAMSAIDESYDGWASRPLETVPARLFATNFLRSISDTRSEAPLTGRLLRQADPNDDGAVSRDEAFKFLQQQLGIRWGDVRLRLGDGRVATFAEFINSDDDRSGAIEKQEYLRRWPISEDRDSEDLERSFELADRNQDQSISVEELAHPASGYWRNPIEWFRSADVDLDGYLDRSELLSATVGVRQELTGCCLNGFDFDEDGKLSLQEYRLSPHANFNYPWTSWPRDEDNDGGISFDEFEFDRTELFHLQRRFYFHRFDRDRDQSLSPDEFPFRHFARQTLAMLPLDGAPPRDLLSIEGELGSPDMSVDGTKIIFHHQASDKLEPTRITSLDIASGRLTELGPGSQPSWSPDGSRFACGREQAGKQIWIVDAKGEPLRNIAAGWAPKWSPDGSRIAYLDDRGLWVYDLAAEKSRQVIDLAETDYRYFWWNGCWSPDSKQMILRGDRLRHSDAVIVNMLDRGEFRVRLSSTIEWGADFSWSPDGDRIVFPMRNTRRQQVELFEFTAAGGDPPRSVEQLRRGFEPKSGCFSPDGKWYICVLASYFAPANGKAAAGGKM